MDVWGSRRFRVRGAMAIAGVATLAIALCSCGVGGKTSESETVVQRFTELLDEKDYGKAADLTSYPAAASATMKQMFEGLQSGTVDYEASQVIDLDKQSAIFSMEVAWNFGEKKDWTYTLQGTVRKLAIGWRISWEPAVVMPQLTDNRTVKLVRTTAKPPPKVVDLPGEALMTEQTLNVIKIDPSRTGDLVGTTNALADAIEPVAPLITGPSLMQQLAGSQGQPIVAVNLRDGDFAILEPRMAKVPGVVMEKQTKLISADRRTRSPMLDALRKVWQDSLEATMRLGCADLRGRWQVRQPGGRISGTFRAGYRRDDGPASTARSRRRGGERGDPGYGRGHPALDRRGRRGGTELLRHRERADRLHRVVPGGRHDGTVPYRRRGDQEQAAAGRHRAGSGRGGHRAGCRRRLQGGRARRGDRADQRTGPQHRTGAPRRGRRRGAGQPLRDGHRGRRDLARLGGAADDRGRQSGHHRYACSRAVTAAWSTGCAQ